MVKNVTGDTNPHGLVTRNEAQDGPKSSSGRRKPATRRPAEPLTRDEAWAVIRACSTRSFTGLRNRALLVVLWRSGVRISEALSLRPADVDAEAGTLRVLHGKGDKARTAYMDREPFEILDRWIDRRAGLELPGDAPLFCTRAGGKIDPSYVRHLLPRMRHRAGVTKRVHAHGFRHTHAVELRQEGVDIKVISTQLGHTSVSTTAHYLDHIAPEQVSRAIRKRRMPRDKHKTKRKRR